MRTLAGIGVALCIAVVVIYGATERNWLHGILAGITMAMAILPEEFPVVLTIFMALGAWRISRSRVLTRRLPAIEALGSATVLCSDKTGTLTRNEMRVARLWSSGGAHAGMLWANALYDAVAIALEHLKKGNRDKRVLIVVSDGADNASKLTKAKILNLATQSDAIIYSLGIYERDDPENKDPHFLRELAKASGAYQFELQKKEKIQANVRQYLGNLSQKKDNLSLRELKAYDKLVKDSDVAVKQLEPVIEDKKKVMDKELTKYAETRRDKRAVEVLKDKAWSRYQEETGREEQNDMDEIGKDLFLKHKEARNPSENKG